MGLDQSGGNARLSLYKKIAGEDMANASHFGRRLVACLAVLALGWPAGVMASCTWSFNWYCSACAKIGGRTTGTQGGYASEAQCEAARRSVAREVTTGSCSSSGYCGAEPTRPAPGGGARTPPGGGGYQPGYDAEAERRRAEEERMRQDAEEADRRAKQKADDDRRQREFLRDKLDTLKTLKGSDFDGRGNGDLKLKGGDDGLQLKSGTPTLDVKPNPGRSAPAAQANSAKESCFSKGTRFTAPVNLSTKDPAGPLTVESDAARELIPDGRLGHLVDGKPWAAPVKAQVIDGVLALERGQPDRAAAILKKASQAAPNDAFLREAANKAAQQAKGHSDGLDPEKAFRWLPKEAHAAYVLGWEDYSRGNMNGAARFFGRALDAAPDNRDLQWLVREVEKQRRVLTPEEQRRQDERWESARTWAHGVAAFRVGMQAAYTNKALAMNYLDEARKALPGSDWKIIDDFRQHVVAGKPLAPGTEKLDRYRSQGDAMLDALEYGKGNWSAALRYLKHARQFQANNPVVEKAYRDLERLSKEAKQ